jgi:hypothetical protein
LNINRPSKRHKNHCGRNNHDNSIALHGIFIVHHMLQSCAMAARSSASWRL